MTNLEFIELVWKYFEGEPSDLEIIQLHHELAENEQRARLFRGLRNSTGLRCIFDSYRVRHRSLAA